MSKPSHKHSLKDCAPVLLVDDDPILRSLVSSRLTAMSASVVEACDGIEAWNILREQDFSAALIDLDMPHLDGTSLIQCLRASPALEHMPVVVITSHDDHAALKNSLEAGATSYMVKPLNWSTFEIHLRHLIWLGNKQVAANRPAPASNTPRPPLPAPELPTGDITRAIDLAQMLKDAMRAAEAPEDFVHALDEIERVLQLANVQDANRDAA